MEFSQLDIASSWSKNVFLLNGFVVIFCVCGFQHRFSLVDTYINFVIDYIKNECKIQKFLRTVSAEKKDAEKMEPFV